jgi:kynureninase
MTRMREQFPILADSTYLVSHSMGAAPLGARAALEAFWDQWASDGPEAWERWLPRIGEIADGIGAIVGAAPGSVFDRRRCARLGLSRTERFDSASRNRKLHRLQRRSQRSRL